MWVECCHQLFDAYSIVKHPEKNPKTSGILGYNLSFSWQFFNLIYNNIFLQEKS